MYDQQNLASKKVDNIKFNHLSLYLSNFYVCSANIIYPSRIRFHFDLEIIEVYEVPIRCRRNSGGEGRNIKTGGRSKGVD